MILLLLKQSKKDFGLANHIQKESVGGGLVLSLSESLQFATHTPRVTPESIYSSPHLKRFHNGQDRVSIPSWREPNNKSTQASTGKSFGQHGTRFTDCYFRTTHDYWSGHETYGFNFITKRCEKHQFYLQHTA
jgi:hypothetical protein